MYEKLNDHLQDESWWKVMSTNITILMEKKVILACCYYVLNSLLVTQHWCENKYHLAKFVHYMIFVCACWDNFTHMKEKETCNYI